MTTILASRGASGGPELVPKPSPEGSGRGPGGSPSAFWNQVGSDFPFGALLGPLLGALGALLARSWAPLGPSRASLRLSWDRLGTVLARLEAILRPCRAVLEPSWGLWSLCGARTRNRKNQAKTIGFSTILASWGSSRRVLGVCWVDLGVSWAALEACGPVWARRLGSVAPSWRLHRLPGGPW